MASVWGELKRRNVVRVAIAYAIAAWLLIEIKATTFPIRVRYNRTIMAKHRVNNSELGQFDVIGEPEQRRRDGETVIHVSRVVE